MAAYEKSLQRSGFTMAIRPFSLAIGAASLVVVTACGGSSSTPATTTSSSASTSPSASPSAQASGATGPATIKLGTTTLGKVLTDSGGFTLYKFDKDKGGSSVCYGECAAAWPAVLTTGAPKSGTGADAALLGTTKRTDGSVQVTYNKLPLYRYAADEQPGWVTGQAVKGIWWVVSAAGTPVKTKG